MKTEQSVRPFRIRLYETERKVYFGAYRMCVFIYLVSVHIVRMIICISLYSLSGLTVEKRIMDLFRAE